jgi:hypothetical protein
MQSLSAEKRVVDTRKKIIDIGQVPALVADGSWIIIAGLFDPLTLQQADRIAELRRTKPNGKVLILVAPRPEHFLTAEARAFLVAALRSVDRVAIGTPEGLPVLACEIVRDDAAEEARSAEFAAFVVARQRAAASPAPEVLPS